MSTRLILLAHGAVGLMREGGFPHPQAPLDASGRAKATATGWRGPRPRRAFHGTETASLETAALLGLDASPAAPLSDAGHGAWAGRAFAEIEAEALAAWLADPAAGTPGGEPLEAVRQRVGDWMDAQAAQDGTAAAVVSATVVRAAVAHVLGVAAAATLRIDVAPLSVAEFSFNRVWRLQRLGDV
ncbi:MAG: histidine phosphatase family protein [Phenylobacterium zucineum]|nr:MAG: histidine phosphatase family protein [Phenylobacterium zucineum]